MNLTDQQRISGICNSQSTLLKVTCLLDAEHEGPHRWWSKTERIKWTPRSEPWRKEPA